MPADKRHSLATQFVTLALGEWQRRLLLGEAPITESEMAAHAELATGIFLKGILPPDGIKVP